MSVVFDAQYRVLTKETKKLKDVQEFNVVDCDCVFLVQVSTSSD